MSDLESWSKSGRLLESFGVGTAVVVAAIGRIGYQRAAKAQTAANVNSVNDSETTTANGKVGGNNLVDIVFPPHDGGLGPVGRALHERLTEIQEGRVDHEGWSVVCEGKTAVMG
jgi:branched-chain amino acid aminotransferase